MIPLLASAFGGGKYPADDYDFGFGLGGSEHHHEETRIRNEKKKHTKKASRVETKQHSSMEWDPSWPVHPQDPRSLPCAQVTTTVYGERVLSPRVESPNNLNVGPEDEVDELGGYDTACSSDESLGLCARRSSSFETDSDVDEDVDCSNKHIKMSSLHLDGDNMSDSTEFISERSRSIEDGDYESSYIADGVSFLQLDSFPSSASLQGEVSLVEASACS